MPVERVDVSVDADVDIAATELTHRVDIQNTAAELSLTGVADTAPSEGSPVAVEVNGEQVFEGSITDPQDKRTGVVGVTAYDAARDLKRASLTQSFDRASIGQITAAACQVAGVTPSLTLPRLRTSAEYTDKRCDEVLGKMADMGGAIWFVDAENTVTVTTDVAAVTEDHQLEYVLDASAGKSTPAYQSVRVYGASPASRKGQSSMHLVSSEPVVANAGSGEPEYTYEDDDIRTVQQAQNVADALLTKLQTQQKGGWIEIVGNASIRPYDTVTMPEHLGGEQYLVTGVKHQLNNDDGFITRLSCGGLINS